MQEKLLTTLEPHKLAAAGPRQESITAAFPTGKTCATVADLKSRTGSARACTEVKRADADSRATTPLAAAGACSAQPGYYRADRHSYCLSDTRITYTLYDPQSGAVTGVGEISLSSSATLDPRSGWWNELFTATVTKTEGHVTNLAVSLTASCSNSCGMLNADAWGTKVLVLGQSVSSHVTFSAYPASGTETMITPQYMVKLYQPGDTPGDWDHNWSLPIKVRCDAELSGYGCVIDQIRALLDLPLSRYGEAAATYWFAQSALVDQWGTPDNPLSRNKDEGAAKANRYRTCEEGSSIRFDPQDDIQDDSCDEYPFAGTFEGGTDGGLCAEILPKFEDGGWRIYYFEGRQPTGNEPCVRGHVPLPKNESAGGKYGNFIQDERVLDTEKFTVSIAG
ncbi:NucA/NucB deoxyribonuclease domain-containing protein [Streptomyces milbemycinicus]|uniref:NucA/NucB deoxyribonuclease domain-containing protein n=1 Tax=Streptomyces milbemycinicus TaxID=476552 RepID=UPI0034079B55